MSQQLEETGTAARGVTTRGPVVIATRGDPSSAAAVRVGGMFAVYHHRPLNVVAVLRPALTPGIAYAEYVDEVHEAACRGIEARVRQQLADAVPGLTASIRVETGAPAEGIAAQVESQGASLIVLGIGRHEAADRWLGLETAIGVIRDAHVPVLAVARDAQVRMTVLAIATDFGPAATEAAQVALELASDDAYVHLLHVASSVETSLVAGLRARLADLAARLPLGGRRTVTLHVLRGDAARAVSEFCDEHGVELVAIGTHGKGWFERLRFGSVSESILRHARCSVLVAPPPR